MYFHPLAKFPGRKIAALTAWYEFYYDVVKHGKFTFEIEKMHREHGPIIRINPTELHINGPSYSEEIYSSTTKLDKAPSFAHMFRNPDSTHSAVSHGLHHLRRNALAPYFSRHMVTDLEDPVIQRTLEKLCVRFEERRVMQEPVNLTLAYRCFTTGVVTEYAMDRSGDFVGHAEFNPGWFGVMRDFVELGHLLRSYPFLLKMMMAIPPWVAERMNPQLLESARWQKGVYGQVQGIKDGKGDFEKQSSRRTIFHELFDTSDLPESEKSVDRLAQEGQLIVGAGTETVGNTLTVTTFYLLNNRDLLAQLKAELNEAMPDLMVTPPWAELEKLPYLSAVIAEGPSAFSFICSCPSSIPSTFSNETSSLSPSISLGVATRSPRISRTQPLTYHNWVVPPGLIQTDPTIFPNPYVFLPERWFTNDESEKAQLAKGLVVFGKGTRACLGINLAYAELYRCLATVFWHFEMESWDTNYERDVKMEHDFLTPVASLESKGVRVLFK